MFDHYGANIEEAINEYNKGNNVYFVECDNSFGICQCNPTSNKFTCKICRGLVRDIRKILPKGIKKIRLREIIKDYGINTDIKFKYDSIAELKNVKYKNVNIGIGALSLFIDLTRNLNPPITNWVREFIDHLLLKQVMLTDCIDCLIQQYKISKIILFNGRQANYRPVLDLARNYNIPFITTEISTPYCKNRYKDNNENSIPHDSANFKKKCDKVWENSSESLERKIEVAQNFFKKKKYGYSVGDKSYISNQEKNHLPDNWDETKENIVIYNSSEDEIAAVGGNWDTHKLFKDQLSGIKEIINRYKDDKSKHLYLRIHPNLTNVNLPYHLDLFKISAPNFTIINSDSKVSSYKLLEDASKIIVFGSSIGIEASYWGKTVISTSYSMYYNFNVVYQPKDLATLWQLIDDKDLKPLDNEETLKYAYYLSTSYRERYKNISMDSVVYKLNKKKIIIPKYAKICGSNFIYAIIRFIVTNYARRRGHKIFLQQ